MNTRKGLHRIVIVLSVAIAFLVFCVVFFWVGSNPMAEKLDWFKISMTALVFGGVSYFAGRFILGGFYS